MLIGSKWFRENSRSLLKITEAPKPFRLVFRNTRLYIMSQNLFRCRNCPERHFSTLLEAVQHVMSERGASKYVQCCVGNCNKTVRDRKLRLHIRKNHKNHCPFQCSACLAKFVEQRDLNNHQRNGCSRRGLPSPPKASLRNKRPTISVRLKSEDIIGEHKAMWQEHLLDLITACLKFNCFLSTTVATQCTFQSSPWWFTHMKLHDTW